MKEKIKTITIIVLILLVCISNVNAITSNEVTYEEGKSLTETLDGLYSELNTYKTGGTVTSDKILTGYTTYSNGSLITGTIPDYTNDANQNGLSWGEGENVKINGYGQLLVGIRSGYYGNVNYGEWDSPAIVIDSFPEKIGLTANKVAAGQTIGNISGTFTNDATASDSKILSGYTAYINGSKVTGTMPNLTDNATITRTTENTQKVIPSDVVRVDTNSDGEQRLEIRYTGSAGYIGTNTMLAAPIATVASTIGLNGEKLMAGKTVLGIAGTATSDATASAGEILNSKTAYVNGSKITGSMANKGKQEYPNLAAGATYTIPAGYHNGTGTVTAATLSSQTGVDSGKSAVTAGTMLEGYQGWVNGNKITGTMRDARVKKSGEVGLNTTYSNIAVLYAKNPQLNTATDGTAIFSMAPVAGYYDQGGSSFVSIKQSDLATTIGLTASKIMAGNTVLGVSGTATSDANATASDIAAGKTAYVNGVKITGNASNRRMYGLMYDLSSGTSSENKTISASGETLEHMFPGWTLSSRASGNKYIFLRADPGATNGWESGYVSYVSFKCGSNVICEGSSSNKSYDAYCDVTLSDVINTCGLSTNLSISSTLAGCGSATNRICEYDIGIDLVIDNWQ